MKNQFDKLAKKSCDPKLNWKAYWDILKNLLPTRKKI